MGGSIKIYVIDASFILASLLPDEKSLEVDEIVNRYLNRELKLISSSIFNLEVLNSLKAAKISKRIDSRQCLLLAERFLKLGIKCYEVDSYQTLLLADKANLSVYDAAYVYLARSKKTSLLTLDARLKKLAR